jgi:hypothetical protein
MAAKARKTRPASRTFRCGPAQIRHEERKETIGHTFTGEKTKGIASIYRVTLPVGEHIDVAYIVWSTGERDVRAEAVESSSRALRRLEHGLRLGIESVTAMVSVMELRQARIKDPRDPKQWSNCFKASLSELREGAGFDVARMLRRSGVIKLGEKHEVLKEYGVRRQFLCATFERDAQWPPIVAYVLTRVLPLLESSISTRTEG